MQCPTTENLLAFGRGLLRGEEATVVQEHLDGCPACRVLVAEAVASVDGDASQPTASPTPPWEPLSPGTSLGRYVVMARIGSGGMGVVYSARDPELDRRVALKILRFDTIQPARLAEAQGRLLREAQATARVVHPNVVAIHDFGRVDERVFLAMEFVEGTTLGARMRAGRMPWREVLGLFLQAGQGLAAAHAAGLVHRDFKPDNVLIDNAGRVRITDFGLVRILDEGVEEPPKPGPALVAPSVPGVSLTQTGALLGTPGYMSPEQARGERPDARSDQFSFCVALLEALYGVRPSARACQMDVTPAERAREVRALQRETGVPDWVHVAVLKGLSPTPGDRHASMDVLLRALRQEPRSRRQKLLGGAAAAVLLAAVGAGVFISTRPALCADDPGAFTDIWDAKTRSTVHVALTKDTLPYAADAWRVVEKGLDAYVRDWTTASKQACEATRIHGRQTEGMFERQLLCLDQRRKDVSALVEVLASADTTVVQNAARAVSRLEDLARCSDVQALTSPRPLPKDLETRQRLEALQKEFATVRARLHAGQLKSALELASTLPARMEGLDYPPAHVEMLNVLAHSQAGLQPRDSVKTLHKLIQTAQAAGLDRQLADGWVALLRVASTLDEQDPENLYASNATAAVARLGGDAELERLLATNLAVFLHAKGRLPEAVTQGLHALELARKAFPAGDARLSTPLLSAGRVLSVAGRFEESAALLKEALARYTEHYGPNHPDVAAVLQALAVQETYLNRYEDALANQHRALAICEKVYGEESPAVASALHNGANMLRHVKGRAEESVAYYRRSVAIREKVFGLESAVVAEPLAGMGQVLRDLGRHAEALALHERALAIREKARGPDSLEAAYDRALIGETLLAMNQPRKARPHLERALAVYEKSAFGSDELLLADMRFLVARALVDQPREARRARDLAQSTLEIYRRFPKARVKEALEVEAWLAAR
ncbi:serine/threonine protein kinase [Myxococcus sp. CA056]|uniref:serine/threonine-protein kinase n=1 Tax=unclassified Myxococcus TaxID=2648731 RepID=UPI00157BB3BB|nr:MULTISPECIES: serine/threonine-protein kinase [unclassified Myxococcus]NTX11447.1 serine/threonine protein kinase [Myxococcus sp. CA056]NTX34455.1 serine/threonine protein kinase [Myxococcus sp. CA033]NTX51596.1 serine/threonine protein kinase [Myxococcus sp. CA039A]